VKIDQTRVAIYIGNIYIARLSFISETIFECGFTDGLCNY